jgi:hypothetical protein
LSSRSIHATIIASNPIIAGAIDYGIVDNNEDDNYVDDTVEEEEQQYK